MLRNPTSRVPQLLVLALIASTRLAAQSGGSATPAADTLAPDPGWPRQFSDGTTKLVVYQPQVDNWKYFRRLDGRFAVALTPKKSGQTYFGTVRIEADSLVDLGSRTVAVTNFTVADTQYPSVKDAAEVKALADLTGKLFPTLPINVSLDRVLAYMDTSQIKARETAVLLEPPPILVATQPAVLVIIDGEPVLYDIEKTNLQKIVNTNWDLFFDKNAKRYYLRNGKSWLSAKALTEGWKVEKKLPRDFRKLPDTDAYKEIRATAASPQTPSVAVLVLVAHKPTELIVVNGAPSFQPVADTLLMWVANTECDLFYNTTDRNYYFLTSGRWFRTPELGGGKWVAATTTLPVDFKKIPLNHPRAHVLASIPGTRQAEEAVLKASIPRTATINRKAAKAEVQYIGDPEFEGIKGTKVSYARNTPNDVLKIGDLYYLCLEGGVVCIHRSHRPLDYGGPDPG
jgi:hypothetical protein